MKRHFWAVGVLALVLANQGCKVVSEKDDPADPDTSSESKSRSPTGLQLTTAEGTATGFASPAFTEGPTLDQSKAAMRALQEADIVQVAGDRLYTLSTAAGLSIIDLSAANKLTLLGQYRLASTPFEMFVQGDTVIALLQGAPVTTDTGTAFTSRIVALDATTPTAVRELSSITVPGTISEGRILDKVLYAASYETLGCHDCNATPTTTVVSVDISAPTSLRQVDREEFPEIEIADGWSKHSVEINDTRMYVSGATTATTSAIQVIDIADTTGNMELGAKVPVTGAIFSRWQMDEYMGVLRVLSQPADWKTQEPTLQTFTITDSKNVTALGSTTLTFPTEDKLRTVRFDGTRAFAITAATTNPLFTLDLSDPANPKQVGQLDMPGFVYHMEVRGDRIYAMGLDKANQAGAIHVSLLDVADLTNPSMLKRVNFGPVWPSDWKLTTADYQEGNENRIHQVFKVLDDLGMILVPHQGWSEQTAGCGNYQSAIQIVDFTQDDLVLRGAAPTAGAIRRAVIHNNQLIGVSEQHVDSFDLTDRSAPKRLANLPLTVRAHRTVPVGDRVLRIRSDWWTHVSDADIVSLADVQSAVSPGTLNLAAELQGDSTACEYHDDSPFMTAPAFAFGDNYVALTVVHPDPTEPTLKITDVLVLDVTGTVPAVVGQLTLDLEPVQTGLGVGVTKIGDALVIQRPGDTFEGTAQDLVLKVIDMTDPTHPAERNELTRPLAFGATGLFVNGTDSASGYYTKDTDENVTFYLDRVSFADAAKPSPSEPVAIPGLLLGRMGKNFVTVDFLSTADDTKNETECATASGEYESASSTCWLTTRPLHLVSVSGDIVTTLASSELDSSLGIFAAIHGNDRVFLPAARGEDTAVLVLGAGDDKLATSIVTAGYSFNNPVIRGTDLFYLDSSNLKRIDATSPASASDVQVSLLAAQAPNHLSMSGNAAIVSFPEAGIQVISL